MIKFVGRLLIMLFLILLVDRGVHSIMTYLTRKSEIRFMRVMRDEPEIIVIGNSRGVNSVSERYWRSIDDRKLINLSFNGMSPIIINSILHDLSKKEEHTNTVYFIELTSYLRWKVATRSDEIACSNHPQFKNTVSYSDNFLPFRSIYPTIDSLFNTNSDYAFNNYIRGLDFNSQMTYRILYYLFMSDGDWANSRTISKEIVDYNQGLKCIEFKLEKESFEDLLQLQKRRNLSIVWFVAPFHPSFSSKFSNLEESILHLKKEYHLEINNLSNLVLSNEQFADGVHTNIKGSIPLTEELKEVLNRYRADPLSMGL